MDQLPSSTIPSGEDMTNYGGLAEARAQSMLNMRSGWNQPRGLVHIRYTDVTIV